MTDSSPCTPLEWPTICKSLETLCADAEETARLINQAASDPSLSADAPDLQPSLDHAHGAYVRLVEAYRGYLNIRHRSGLAQPLDDAPAPLQALASRHPEAEDVGALLQRLSFAACLAATEQLEEMLAAFASLASTGPSSDQEGRDAG